MRGSLEGAIAMELEQDPEHAPILRLTVILPGQDSPGQWQADVPDWIRLFAAIASSPEKKFGPFGSRPAS